MTAKDIKPHVEEYRIKGEQRVNTCVMNNATAMKGFSPRWVAHTLGLDLGNVISACKRLEALGHIERYERPIDKTGHATEVYYRLKHHPGRRV